MANRALIAARDLDMYYVGTYSKFGSEIIHTRGHGGGVGSATLASVIAAQQGTNPQDMLDANGNRFIAGRWFHNYHQYTQVLSVEILNLSLRVADMRASFIRFRNRDAETEMMLLRNGLRNQQQDGNEEESDFNDNDRTQEEQQESGPISDYQVSISRILAKKMEPFKNPNYEAKQEIIAASQYFKSLDDFIPNYGYITTNRDSVLYPTLKPDRQNHKAFYLSRLEMEYPNHMEVERSNRERNMSGRDETSTVLLLANPIFFAGRVAWQEINDGIRLGMPLSKDWALCAFFSSPVPVLVYKNVKIAEMRTSNELKFLRQKFRQYLPQICKLMPGVKET